MRPYDAGGVEVGLVTGIEWVLLIVVVILIPLVIAVAVTLWTLEQARLRNKRNRPDRAIGVKRKATRELAPGEVRRGRRGAESAGGQTGTGAECGPGGSTGDAPVDREPGA